MEQPVGHLKRQVEDLKEYLRRKGTLQGYLDLICLDSFQGGPQTWGTPSLKGKCISVFLIVIILG